jgi:hypothetical protein
MTSELPKDHPPNKITPWVKNQSTDLFPPSKGATMDGIVSGVADFLGNTSSLTFFDALSEDLSLFPLGKGEISRKTHQKQQRREGKRLYALMPLLPVFCQSTLYQTGRPETAGHVCL